MNLPKRLTRHQAEPLCEYYCTGDCSDCFGDCECNVGVQQAWTKLRERLLGDYSRYSDLEERMKRADNDATRFAIKASKLRTQVEADEALLRQAENDLHMVRGGYGKALHEKDIARLDRTIAALQERLGEPE